jgi:hypothetical protein
VIPRETLDGYSPTGAVLTLVLPLALFIVVMIGMSFVFFRPRTMSGPTVNAARPDIAAAGDDDTVVSETLVSDPGADADADSGAAGDPAIADSPSGGTAVDDPDSTQPPDDPE